MSLTAKQAQFVAEYLVDRNATAAAIRAGYSQKTAYSIGSENLSKPEIALAIADRTQQALDANGLTPARVLEEVRRLAFADLSEAFAEDGTLKPLRQIPKELRAAISSVKTLKTNLTSGDGAQEVTREIKLWDKAKALQQAMEYFALLEPKVTENHIEIVIKAPW